MRKEIIILLAIAAIVVIAAVIGTSYYRKSVGKVESGNKVTNTNTAKPPSRADANILIKPDSPTLGAPNAPVTLTEFYDPECESCRAMYPIVKQILKDYQGKVRLVMRYMPLHGNSMLAAQVTEAAGEQGKYWEMQELLFNKQQEWGEKREPQTALFEKYATELGLNLTQFRTAIADNRYTAKIERDKRDGQSVGVRSTPTFFVNGRPLARLGEPELKSLIEEELKK